MDIYQKLVQGKSSLAVVGLGYVGLPLAVAFAKKFSVIGFDTNQEKVQQYQQGIDPTCEVGNQAIQASSIHFTADPAELTKASFYVVAVPTPVNGDHSPDLEPVEAASRLVGRYLNKNSIVVFESTVFPGVTEDICVPLLEQNSGLTYGIDFKVGYSPERINPADKVHRLENIVKVVSGMDAECLETITNVYGQIIDAGVHPVKDIRVAEASKIVENAQRDINIAFMNELSIIFHKMGINMPEVLAAARTKWNFLDFTPGLVGGHCIGVDPYYLTYKADQLGYHSRIILAGRKINDDMAHYLADTALKLLVRHKADLPTVRVGVFGLTFKDECPDTRNTRIIDFITDMQDLDIQVQVCDPLADRQAALASYQLELVDDTELNELDLLVVANGHKIFREQPLSYWLAKLKGPKIILDLKSILDKEKVEAAGALYWTW